MPAYKVRALVLRKTKLGESDLILTLLAEDGRQIRAVAKGARKPGSRLSGSVELHTVADFLLHTGRTLDVVSESCIVESHADLRVDLERCEAAAAVADLLDKITVEGQTEERLFGLAVATLHEMVSAEIAGLDALLVACMVKAIAMHGYRPELGACANCGRAMSAGVFSFEAGGIVCDGCSEGEQGAYPLSAEGVAALRRMLYSTMADVVALEVTPAVAFECFEAVRGFIRHHVPARTKALEYYGTVMRARL